MIASKVVSFHFSNFVTFVDMFISVDVFFFLIVFYSFYGIEKKKKTKTNIKRQFTDNTKTILRQYSGLKQGHYTTTLSGQKLSFYHTIIAIYTTKKILHLHVRTGLPILTLHSAVSPATPYHLCIVFYYLES